MTLSAGIAPGRRGGTGVIEQQVDAAWWRAVSWAREVCADPTAVYLDTETTGLGGDAEVVDIALVSADGRVLLDTLVRPQGPIPAAASRIHGIVAEDVRWAPGWDEVHAELCALLHGRAVVVYNADYDRRIVSQCCQRHRLADVAARWHCAMRQYAVFRGEGAGRRGHRWHRLEHAAVSFGAAPGGHRALGDALSCRAVVLGMAAAEA
ncbi:MAG: DNA polymerase III epsilon subunit [uncultured Thermomicrobiales bacterium]|uniref:DNA polymerase III epsilon subunit n=1 Tax=uncultured Thermomicrobiales bacterium TaxID=1645740 RepID=A0A6J4UB03_9BACT|nr:MAG: DNA polymerase III epsilon subunit [uncultured Thermomicrobiales bacterium]